MSTNEPMTQEQLDAIQERVNAATDGPWAPWLDQDGQPHMHGRLMVGVAAGVIPDGETWVEGSDVNNPIAHTFTPEDRAFISHAREDVPALLAEVHRLRDELTKAREPLANLRCAVVSAARECGEWESKAEDAQRELAKAREITDDMIERAAVQMCASGRNESIWKNTLYEEEREAFRKDARVALEAALDGGDDA